MASVTRETLPNFFGNVASATVLAMVGLLFSATPTEAEKGCRGSQPLIVVVPIPAPAKLDQPDETKIKATHLARLRWGNEARAKQRWRVARNDARRGDMKLIGRHPAQRRGGMTAKKVGST